MDRQIAVCIGMSWWKRRRVADFLATASGRPVFRGSVKGAIAAATARGGAIAVWATREPRELAAAAASRGIPLVRVEDGFLRSVGLGSDFLPGASIVLEEAGIYFDPHRESDLERLLRDGAFDAELLARARRLVDRLVANGVTKYNLADRGQRIPWPPGRRRILVPGQVEDDLSVRLGGGQVRGNLGLLARVRAANPDAFIAYKPHPDVVAGHRKGAIRPVAARRHADLVVRGGSLATLFGEIDELHTLTSLSGFEALLRRVPVTVYGRPFYAGWGLTRDVEPWDRGRVLSLEQLAAGALILYPRLTYIFQQVTRLFFSIPTIKSSKSERQPLRDRRVAAGKPLWWPYRRGSPAPCRAARPKAITLPAPRGAAAGRRLRPQGMARSGPYGARGLPWLIRLGLLAPAQYRDAG